MPTSEADRSLIRAGWGIVLCLAPAVLASWLRVALMGTLKVDDAQPSVAVQFLCGTLLIVGLGGASWLFLRAWHAASGHNLRPLLCVALALHAVAFAALPLTSNDIFSNLAYGREANIGLNPFHDAPADLQPDPIVSFVGSLWLHWPTCYGPLVIDLSSLAARPAGVYLPVVLFKLALFACVIGAVLVAFHFCHCCVSSSARSRSFVLLAWNPLLAWEVSGQTHNDGLLVFALMVFTWAATRNRQWTAALALIVGLYAKFVALPIIGLYGLCVLRRNWKRAVAMLAATLAAGAALFAPYWRGIETLRPACEASTALPDYLCNSLTYLVCEASRWFSLECGPLLFLVMLVATRLVCLGMGSLFAWRATSAAQVSKDSLLFLLVYECLGMGWFQPWYAVWLLPLAVGCGDTRLQRIVAIYTALVPIFYLPHAGFYIGVAIVQLTPLAMLLLDRPALPATNASEIGLFLQRFAWRRPSVVDKS